MPDSEKFHMEPYPILKTDILDKIHLRYSSLLTYSAIASFIICLIVFTGRISYTPYKSLFQSIHDPVIRTIFLGFFCATMLLMLFVSISGEEIWKAGTIILTEDTITIQQKKTEISYSFSQVVSFKVIKTDKKNIGY